MRLKMKNFADDANIFLRDITCLNRMQAILKLYHDVSNLKINFLKANPYELEHIKNRNDQPKQIEWS